MDLTYSMVFLLSFLEVLAASFFGDPEVTGDPNRRRVLYSKARIGILNIVWMANSQYVRISKFFTFGLPMTNDHPDVHIILEGPMQMVRTFDDAVSYVRR